MEWRWDSNIEYLLRRTHQRCSEQLDQRLESDFGLSVRYWPVLQTLFLEQGIQQILISERTGEPGYQTSRVLDKLEDMKLVERRSDPMNHRARLVYLTEAGESLRKPLAALAHSLEETWLADMSKSDTVQLKSLLTAFFGKTLSELHEVALLTLE